jgi:hypothetical protein
MMQPTSLDILRGAEAALVLLRRPLTALSPRTASSCSYLLQVQAQTVNSTRLGLLHQQSRGWGVESINRRNSAAQIRNRASISRPMYLHRRPRVLISVPPAADHERTWSRASPKERCHRSVARSAMAEAAAQFQKGLDQLPPKRRQPFQPDRPRCMLRQKLGLALHDRPSGQSTFGQSAQNFKSRVEHATWRCSTWL